ncbi:MAG TPA: ATP-binding cassette domain-containing protein, partial [Acidimicrobiales bacterium]|nr:ATP-binding cassette domain-containing protein [Acidimicrobiales bacterium]
KVAAALERLGLVGRVRRTRASSLSSGQRRRTALAGLLARNPQVWLLDEPYSGLDPQGREILGEILAEVSSQGSTVMAVSHEPAGLAQLAHSVVTMGGGRILSKVFGPGPVPSVAVPDPSVAVPVPTPGEEPAGVA